MVYVSNKRILLVYLAGGQMIHISNVQLIDPKTGEPTRIGRKPNAEGKLQRYSKKTGDFI